MEIATLTAFLSPFLPHLVKAGQKAAEAAGEKIGSVAWTHAKALWERLRPNVEEKPAAHEAVQDVAKAPDDEDARAALRLQLKKLLTDDPVLAEDMTSLWRKAERDGVSVDVSGERAVGIGGNVIGSQISTGDRAGPTSQGDG